MHQMMFKHFSNNARIRGHLMGVSVYAVKEGAINSQYHLLTPDNLYMDGLHPTLGDMRGLKKPSKNTGVP